MSNVHYGFFSKKNKYKYFNLPAVFLLKGKVSVVGEVLLCFFALILLIYVSESPCGHLQH